MKILFLAPHPFFQERGTPIAENLVLRVLSHAGHQLHLLTYSEGKDVAYPGLRTERVPALPFVNRVRPGFSWKKLLSSFVLMVMAIRAASRGKYDSVHAVEEGVFIALLLRKLFGIPYVYDMDSSMADQLVEQKPYLAIAAAFLRAMEGLAIRNARGVLPVCQALADTAKKQGAREVLILHDISLLHAGKPGADVTAIRSERNIRGPMMLYVGNLEKYQGVDLLLDAFALLAREIVDGHLVLIGGASSDIAGYRKKAEILGISNRVHFLGPKPISDLSAYLEQADILTSPRVKGRNTPMKIYTYLDSGKPVLATRIYSHTQVISEDDALLVDPEPHAMMVGMRKLIDSAALRAKFGEAGKKRVAESYNYEVFAEKLSSFYTKMAK